MELNMGGIKSKSRKYIVSRENLKVGDIILMFSGGLGSKLISKSTGSQYSHVMIWCDDYCVHAVPEGIYSINIDRVLVSEHDYIKVIRYEGGSGLGKVVEYAKNKIGSLYSKVEAVKVKAYPELANKNVQFCSRLVAQAYHQAGIEIVDDPDFCSPGDIEKSGLLTEVGNIVDLASERQIKFAKSVDPRKIEQSSMYDFLNPTFDVFKKNGCNVNNLSNIFDGLTRMPKLDKEVTDLLDLSGYLSFVDQDRDINNYRYDFEVMKEKIMSKDEGCLSYLNDFWNSNRREYERRVVELQEIYELKIKYAGVSFFERFFDLRYRLLQNVMDRIRVYQLCLEEYSDYLMIKESYLKASLLQCDDHVRHWREVQRNCGRLEGVLN